MSKKYTGHCACGQVTYGFESEPVFVANCHCTDCKRASGGEMATFVAVPDTDLTVFSGDTRSFSMVRTKSRDLHVEPPRLDAAARRPTIRPGTQVGRRPTRSGPLNFFP